MDDNQHMTTKASLRKVRDLELYFLGTKARRGDIEVANWKACRMDLTMSVVTAVALISCSWLNGMVTFNFLD